MVQRLFIALAVGVAAFVVVTLGALGAYVVVAGPTNTQAQVAQQSNAQGSPQQGIVDGSGLPQPPNFGGNNGDIQSDYSVSSDAAAGIALNSAPGSSLVGQPRLVNFSGTTAYEVQLDTGMVYVDAGSGQVLYNGTTAGANQPPQRFHRRNR
ncbi:MAG: hypothetical protein ABI670_18285 [Chloroflexota bacterium]